MPGGIRIKRKFVLSQERIHKHVDNYEKMTQITVYKSEGEKEVRNNSWVPMSITSMIPSPKWEMQVNALEAKAHGGTRQGGGSYASVDCPPGDWTCTSGMRLLVRDLGNTDTNVLAASKEMERQGG